jgi:lipoprotein-releasing system ATP-binding protein
MTSGAAATSGRKLTVNHLAKEYPTPAEPLVVLKDVTLEMSAGDSLAIVGPSGSGKSTLLNILGTLDHPTSGTVRLNDIDPFSLSEKELAEFRSRNVGFVFQEHHLLPQCTALENVLLPRIASEKKADDAAEQRARDLMQRVGLANRMTHFPSELSGGERQRVAVARAMMNQPPLMLADEPTGNLDAANSAEIGKLLAEAAAQINAILIVVTHSAALAETFTRRLMMSQGRLVAGGG